MPETIATPKPKNQGQRELAYDKLRRLLILQRVPEGERLREPEWVEKLGVNRVALREAFARLEAEGLIERGPVSGYRVPELSDEEMREILRVRCILECGAIDELCRAGKPDERALKPMEDACDELAHLIERSYLLGASEADRRFHEVLVAAAGNRRLSMLYQRAPLPMLHGRIIGQEQWAAECRVSLDHHRQIVAALRQADGPSAKEILRRHLDEHPILPLHH